ncbi:MAG: PilZ domain-containing protein [Planctomycetota bacterium]|nr:PilZ domain-containing protein [Planctomycetota bacterium]
MPDAKDFLRLNEQERRAALETIERRALSEPGRLSRREPRHRLLDVDRLTVDIGTGSSVCTALVVPRDVSDGGLSFLHGVFIYSGTHILIQLKTRDGEQMLVPGKVVRCTHVVGRVHEVGVKFDRPIDVAPFVAFVPPERAGHAPGDVWASLHAQHTELAGAIQTKDLSRAGRAVASLQSLLVTKPGEATAPAPVSDAKCPAVPQPERGAA